MPYTADQRRAGAADVNSFMIHVRTIRSEYLAGLVRDAVAAVMPGRRRAR